MQYAKYLAAQFVPFLRSATEPRRIMNDEVNVGIDV